MMRIASIASVVLFLGCTPTPNGSTPPVGEIEFRVGTGEGDSTGSAFYYDGLKVYLGPAHTYLLSRVYLGEDRMGLPGLGFEVTGSQADEFEEWTGSIVGSPLAVVVNGVIVAMPEVAGALPGKGVIGGGGDGFTAKEVYGFLREITSAK